MKKILWFSLSPCGSIRRFNKERVFQGWMISLEDELKKNKDIELHVAFLSGVEGEEFFFEGVHYHPMLLKSSNYGLLRVLDRYVTSFAEQDKRMLPIMLQVVSNVNPDLIHIHGTEERFGLIQDYVKDIPIAFSIQGLIGVFGEKFFSGIPKAEVFKYDKLYNVVRHVGIKNDYACFVYQGKRERHYLSNAQYILGRTFWDRDITLALNPNRKYYVADEIMRTPFYDKQWNKGYWSKGKLTIISTISGGIYKGLEVVLKASRLLKLYSGIDFEWMIAGYERESYWMRVYSRYTHINPDDESITLLGRLGAEELSQRLADADIYVHVSHIENSPNSVCEAMLVGMPIIASYAGGTATLLKNGVEGELVQDGDPYVLAGAILDMYQHFDRAKAYGQAARKTALVRHDAKRIVNELTKTYDEIINDFVNRG